MGHRHALRTLARGVSSSPAGRRMSQVRRTGRLMDERRDPPGADPHRPRDPRAQQGRERPGAGGDRQPRRRRWPAAWPPRSSGSRASRSRSASSTSRSTATTSGCGPRRPRSTRPGSSSTSPEPTVVLVDDVLFTGRTIRAAHGRADGLRPAAGDPAGGPGRPRPPRAADPGRLRRQERPHPAWTRTSRSCCRRWTARTPSWSTMKEGWSRHDQAPPVDQSSSRAEDVDRILDTAESFREVGDPRSSRRCRRCAAGPS